MVGSKAGLQEGGRNWAGKVRAGRLRLPLDLSDMEILVLHDNPCDFEPWLRERLPQDSIDFATDAAAVLLKLRTLLMKMDNLKTFAQLCL